MKRQLICLLLLAVYPLFGSQFAKKDDAYTIRMNNRPLLVLQGKVYTLFDVVKNMDAKMKEYNIIKAKLIYGGIVSAILGSIYYLYDK